MNTWIRRISGLLPVLIVAVVATGCAGPGTIVPGTTTADELAGRMGRPTEIRPAPGGGEYRDYAYGPAGFETWRFHVAQGRVSSVTQLLTLERLYRIVPGQTTMDQTRDLLGSPHPRNISQHPLSGETTWEYRVELQPTPVRGMYIVRFDSRGIAAGIHVLQESSSDSGKSQGGGGP